MALFYKLFEENKENDIKNISEILRYLIKEKGLLTNEYIEKIKLVINIDLILSLFDNNVDFLSILIQKIQYDDIKFSELFNTNYISKLYTHCSEKPKEKNMKYKLLKFIISLLGIIDKYAFDSMYTLLGYPS